MELTEAEKATAKAIVSGLLWQPAEGHNYRFRFAVRTLTRFCEAVSLQPDEMKLVLEFLRTQEVGADGISLLNRTVYFGAGWKAKDAWYQTMPGERWGNTESTKVRIYQVLVQPSDDGKDGDGPYLVENGCQYRVEHTFYWDVEELPTCPSSESGVSVALQGVTRDRETGLFSCVIETRTRVQQDVAAYTASETAFLTTKDEQHIGVRAEKVATTGLAAGVSHGKLTRRRLSKNADCTSDIQNETVTEKPVTGAVVEFRKTLRGTSRRQLDRSQSVPLNGKGLKIGEMRRSQMTDGELWDNEMTQTDADAAGTTGKTCARNALSHSDTEVENVVEMPVVENGVPVVNEEIRTEARRTDEGTWDVSRTRIAYTPKSTGVLTDGTVCARTETTVGVNQPKLPADGVGGVNVLRKLSAQPNEHGSFSTREEVTTYRPARQATTGGTPTQTETTETGIHQPSVPAGGAGGVNRRVDVSVSLNDHGSMTTQRRTIVYHPRKVSTTGGTPTQTETTETGIHQPFVPAGGAGGVNRRVDVSVSLNDHGSMTTQRRTIVYSPVSVTSQSQWATETVRRKTTVNDLNLSPSAVMGEASGTPNDHGSATTSIVEYTPRSVDSGWITWDSTVKSPSSTLVYACGLRVFKNLKTITPPPSGSDCSTNVHINKFGLYDGSITYRKLVSWTREAGGAGSGGLASKTTLVATNTWSADHKKRLYNRERMVCFNGRISASQFASNAEGAYHIGSAGGILCFRSIIGSVWQKVEE